MKAKPIVAGTATRAPAPAPRKSAGAPNVTALLPGAEACRAMLASIEALPPVPDGADGTRRDYEGADAILNQALDQHGSDLGFRRVLSVYLQSVANGDLPQPSREDAKSLLIDGGYRPVAMPHDSARGLPAPDNKGKGNLDFEDSGYKLETTLVLLSWIERARNLLDAIQTHADLHEDFAARMQHYGIPVHDATWEGEESSALAMLLSAAAAEARAVREAGIAIAEGRTEVSHA